MHQISSGKDRLIELFWALQDIMTDLVTSVDVYFLLKEGAQMSNKVKRISAQIPLFYEKPNDLQIMSLNRITLFPIVIALTKINELRSAYGKEINELADGSCGKALSTSMSYYDLESLRRFRHSAVAHPLKKNPEGKRPLTRSELTELIIRVLDKNASQSRFSADDMKKFLRRIHKRDGACLTLTIRDVCKKIEDSGISVLPRP